MKIKFTKMHGLGNDFIVIDAVRQKIDLTPQQISSLSNRYTGIGFDQCLIVEPSTRSGVDFLYKIYNANGNEVGQCGNGARCLARFLQKQGITDKKSICVVTNTTQMQLNILENDTVTIDMGRPKLHPADIPISVSSQNILYNIPIPGGFKADVHAINVGNPHAILIMKNPTDSDVCKLGKIICEHEIFPEQVNVGFMSIVNQSHINLRVFERGCGETMACGSGAVAAAAAGRLYHNMEEQITVTLPGGDLNVIWPDVDGSIFLNGPAVFVYDGVLESICA
ncbi:MAG: diaminopimelate epimerase [Legionellaceae bacterium]|nr:diaminopimelate epimerase [Legionellaceae bacterium]